MSINFIIWVKYLLYLWACSNLPSKARSPRHNFCPVFLCKCCAPSAANVWNKLNKQDTVGNLGNVLIRNIFTHGVRLCITYSELWFEPPIASNKALKWGCIFYQISSSIFIYFFVTYSHKTSLWTVQMQNSTCPLGNMYKCQLFFPDNFFHYAFSSKCQKII